MDTLFELWHWVRRTLTQARMGAHPQKRGETKASSYGRPPSSTAQYRNRAGNSEHSTDIIDHNQHDRPRRRPGEDSGVFFPPGFLELRAAECLSSSLRHTPKAQKEKKKTTKVGCCVSRSPVNPELCTSTFLAQWSLTGIKTLAWLLRSTEY